MKQTDQNRRDHWQEVTNAVVAALEKGTPPWRRPWDPNRASPTGPVNAATGHHYRGINVLLLGCNARAWETGDPRWCSYKQAQERGWQVRGGEKATTIFFYKPVEIEDKDAQPTADGDPATKLVPVLRSYPVFHASQIDGIPAYVPPTPEECPWRRPEAVDTIMTNSGVSLRIGGDRAFYSPSTDHIQLPPDATFSSREAWAATALHELGHSTGHPSRLNRDLRNRFGSAAYAQEELRAELASVFVCSEIGIPPDLEQHASYVESWIKALKHDKREIFRAAADAQKAADWCLSHHPDYRLALGAPEGTEDAKTTPTVTKPSTTMPVAASEPFRPEGLQPVSEAMPEHLRRRLYGPMPEAPVSPDILENARTMRM